MARKEDTYTAVKGFLLIEQGRVTNKSEKGGNIDDTQNISTIRLGAHGASSMGVGRSWAMNDAPNTFGMELNIIRGGEIKCESQL
jgi:hypothetical protein